MPASARVSQARVTDARALLRDWDDAVRELAGCFGELEKILARPGPEPAALTSVRLRIAGLRLSRGSLASDVSTLLSGSLSDADEAMLQDLHRSHRTMLQIAAAHTGKWTLAAIAGNWAEYRRATRELILRWVAKVERERRLLYPLVQQCAED